MVTFICFAAWGGLMWVAIPALRREIESETAKDRRMRGF